MPKTVYLVFTFLSFQYVRIIEIVYGLSNGMRDFRYLINASRSSTIFIINSWMRKILNSMEALLSYAATDLYYGIVHCTECLEHYGKAFTEERFVVDLNIGRFTGIISLFLCETLEFRNMVIM